MNRLTLPTVLLATLLVVSASAVGAVAAPIVSGDTTATAMQDGDGNTTVTPTPAPTATPTPSGDQSSNDTGSSNATATNETNTSDAEPTFGAVVSSFMQTSAVDAENEVEDGLFAAQFERSNASERARLVRQRAGSIGERIAELREERAELLGGENVTVRERAEAARLAEQSDGLANSIDQTEQAAQRANVELNRTALDELRGEARNLTGPEVAELARGLVDKEDSPRRGPPEDRGPGGDAEETLNGTDTEPSSGEDAPGRSGDAPGRSSDAPGGDRTGNDRAEDTSDDSTETATPTPTTTDGDGTDGNGADAGERGQSGENDAANGSPR